MRIGIVELTWLGGRTPFHQFECALLLFTENRKIIKTEMKIGLANVIKSASARIGYNQLNLTKQPKYILE